MSKKFLKPYSPVDTESKIYSLWENSGFFNPDNLPGDRVESFSMVMPPPNVTGVLHMGHALMLTIQDILIRYKRMKGYRTLWIPGTDHAAIATQSKVEKEISKKEGKNRNEIGREELLKRIDNFAKESHDTIKSQIKTLGASCDWSREAFTLDSTRTLAVNTMFKEMYDDGLIYRGSRIVNWDPKGQTVISDDEIVYKEEKSVFYYLKYGPFTIGTSRPETKFGDKYVVMHPDDERYSGYEHGQEISLEWISGPITATVIKDTSIDKDFGTGVMTITPWHDVTDFDIAERYKLDKEQIIDGFGKLLPVANEFSGMKIREAREKIIDKLRLKGLLIKEEPYTHNVATAERTGGLIEPQVMKQWFISVNTPVKRRGGKTLKQLMREPIVNGEIKILPEHFDKTYFHWIDNLRDWCISRQIWYGHRIPVWYKNGEEHCGLEPPKSSGWVQDPDTLDTWFSSGLWSFSTLGWPEKTKDLKTYHPTNVLETGYEILFFWVARMILMSQYALGEIPFKQIYLHGTIRDQKGQKMSKSLDNGIDPLDVAKEFGTDAGRMALIVGNTPGTDTRIWNDKIKAYKNFANKIWNAARFVLEQNPPQTAPEITLADQEYIDQLETLVIDITKDMDGCRFYIAAEKLYHYFWHTFADKILEEVKDRLKNGSEKEKTSGSWTLLYILKTSLVLLHPFMPFITEEIWQEIDKGKSLLIIERWPS